MELETRSLLRGVKTGSDGLHFVLPHEANHYEGERQVAYGFRVLDGTGRVVAAKQPALLEAISPWRPNAGVATDFWFLKLDGSRPFYFAGGKRLRVADSDVLIEIVTLGDPASIRWWAVLWVTAEDVWLPIAPFVILIPIMTTIAVRRTKTARPCSQQAEMIKPGHLTQQLDLEACRAKPWRCVSQRSHRAGWRLVQSQKIFIASAAHELPQRQRYVAGLKIDHPRARRLDADVAGMTESVNRPPLARLETVNSPELVDLDLGAIASETIDRLRTWAAVQDLRSTFV